MKKWMMIPFIATLVITGCTENSDSGDGDLDPNAITIDAFVPKMQKGVDATTSTLASGISIYAYKTGEAYSTSPFMKGVVFTKPGAGNWTSSPVTYWPMYPLDFFGFYPKTVAPTDVAVPTKFAYTVAPDAANQFDVVTSFTGNQDRELVQMKYHHALSKINFKITTFAESGLNVTVNGITMKNIPMSASFDFNTTATAVPNYFTVTNQAPVNPSNGNSLITPAQPIVVNSSTADVSSDLITGMYLIPHKLVNWAYTDANAYPLTGTYINIQGSLSGITNYTGNIAIPIITSMWQPGYSYTYNIIFGNPNGGSGGGGYNPDNSTDGNKKPEQILMPILVSVTVDEWVDINPPVPPVDL
ncbi:MAG: fimbrillin family protein [Bacteroidales bacterium]